jgi:hypothetical protein
MYQPKISEENIHKLYKLRIHKKMPMTRVLEDILNEYFDSLQENTNCEETENSLTSIEQNQQEQILG